MNLEELMPEYVECPWNLVNPTHVPTAYRTTNLGDDIQSYVATKLFNCNNLVDRDYMAGWKRDMVVPMIGWYGYGSFTSVAQLIFVGFHASSNIRSQIVDKKKWVKDLVKEQGFPAFCRDTSTRDFLRSLDIDAEFGGCVTTSLLEYNGYRHGNYDIDYNLSDFNPKVTQVVAALKHIEPEKRLELAKDRLELIKEAESINTSRLHVWLPAKMYGTKVNLFLHENIYEPIRFSGYNTNK